MMKSLIILSILLLNGCAGKLVCEWQSQSEQFERVLEKYIGEKDAETQTQQETKPQAIQSGEQSSPEKYAHSPLKRRVPTLKESPGKEQGRSLTLEPGH